MFGYLYQSALSISNFLWEVAGGVFGAACLYSLRFLFDRKHRSEFGWYVLSGILFALWWRYFFRTGLGRYYSISVVPALFLCFAMIWTIFPQKWIKYLLLFTAFGGCFAHLLHSNPYEKSVMELYDKVRTDSQAYRNITCLSFTKHGARERYYTGLPVQTMDRDGDTELLWKNLRSNLGVWDGDRDAVYLFIVLKKGEQIPADFLRTDDNRKLTVIGESFLDRKQKKKIVMFRYLPSAKRDDAVIGELLPNGDFKKLCSEKENQYIRQQFGKLSVRFLQEKCVFPAGWPLYQSRLIKSDSFATVVQHEGVSAYRLEADGYLTLTTPTFSVTGKRVLSFQVSAITKTTLQISRDDEKARLLPFLVLVLKGGTTRRYNITLPYVPGCKNGRICFWVHHGKIEFSDLRIQQMR